METIDLSYHHVRMYDCLPWVVNQIENICWARFRKYPAISLVGLKVLLPPRVFEHLNIVLSQLRHLIRHPRKEVVSRADTLSFF